MFKSKSKKRFFLVIAMFLLVKIAYAGLEGSCTIRQSCNEGESTILSATGNINAHISRNLTKHDYEVCCPGDKIAANCSTRFDFVFNSSSSFSADILKLSTSSNAQVQTVDFAQNIPYPDKACLSSASIIQCGYFQDQCPSDKKCVLKVSGETNAHVESCENNNYNLNLCCNTFFTKIDLEGTIGYCPKQTQCLKEVVGDTNVNDPESYECVESDVFVEDNYCENGEWTTRTKFIALQLLGMASGDYTLFCDNHENSLNNVKYIVGEQLAESLITSGTNNFCVMSYDDKIVFGTSLNQDINNADLPFLDILEIDDCNVFDDDNYYPCDNSNKAWYNSRVKAIIYSRDAIALRGSGSFVQFLKNPFEFILNYLRGNVEPPSNSFVSDLKKFNRLYLAKSREREIRASMEGLQFKNAVFEYKNFQTDLCKFIDEYGKTIDSDASGIRCSEDGNDYYVLVQGSFGTNLKPEDIWTDLTSSLRIG